MNTQGASMYRHSFSQWECNRCLRYNGVANGSRRKRIEVDIA